LIENPKEPSQAAPAPAFSFQDHRLLKQNENLSSAVVETEQPMALPPAPPPPIISAAPPPINRRRLPKRMVPSPVPPPIDKDDLLAHSAIMSANSVLSQNSVDSTYSNINTGIQNLPQPLPPRARTPVSAAKHLVSPPVSAPMPNNNLISPLLRSSMSTASFRMKERSESFREQKDSDSYKSRDWDGTDYRDRDRLPKSARASPIPRGPIPLPLRSANRPGSAMSQRTPVAVPQHEGMI
jgi:hypothetical protein